MEKLIKINQNIDLLTKEGYMTPVEIQFLNKVSDMIQHHTNAISTNHVGFMTIQEISSYLDIDCNEADKNINSLVKKGILFEFINKVTIHDYHSMTSRRPLFMNPEIMYRGDVNKLDATLCTLVSHFDKIDRKIKMPFKVFLASDAEYGMIYPREWIDHFLKEIQYKI